MQANSHFKLYTAFLLLGVFLLAPIAGWTQSEGQSSDHALEFQRTDKQRRPVRVLEGDLIVFPYQTENNIVELKGEVVSIGDSTFMVKEARSDKEVEINLAKISYFKHVNKARKTAGWILTALGIAYSVAIVFAIFAALTLGAGIGAGVIPIFLLVGLFLNPISWVLFGLGIPLIKTATKRISRNNWVWKKLRRVIVKVPR